MARWSAHHRKKAIFGWLGLAVALFAISMVSPMKKIVFETSGPGESGRMDKILYEDFRQPGGEAVLVQSRTLTATQPEFTRAVKAVVAGVAPLDAIAKVESPFEAGNEGQVSADRHSAYVGLELSGDPDNAADIIDPVVARVDQVQKANPDFYIGSFGTSTGKEVQAGFFDDLKRAGEFSVPLTLLILVIAFGALVAAGIPLLLAMSAVLATWASLR